jgi:hypothetical protein
MPELGASGSVRGALRNERPYRERNTVKYRKSQEERQRGVVRPRPHACEEITHLILEMNLAHRFCGIRIGKSVR